jgi:alpha-amylase/alpha-mannosidase (GH57 family)
VHTSHVKRSKEILEQTFGTGITTLIPPGNVYAPATLEAAKANGFTVVNCNTTSMDSNGLKIIGNAQVMAFHDKEIVELGISWLAQKIQEQSQAEFVFVRDLP